MIIAITLAENICSLFSFNNVIGLITILIPFFSLLYVIKKHRKEKRLKRLREDKSILDPLLSEYYDYILQVPDKFNPDGIIHILRSIAIEKLHNKEIGEKIADINKEGEPIFLHDGGRDYAVNSKIEELFKEIRHYLGEVIP